MLIQFTVLRVPLLARAGWTKRNKQISILGLIQRVPFTEMSAYSVRRQLETMKDIIFPSPGSKRVVTQYALTAISFSFFLLLLARARNTVFCKPFAVSDRLPLPPSRFYVRGTTARNHTGRTNACRAVYRIVRRKKLTANTHLRHRTFRPDSGETWPCSRTFNRGFVRPFVR